MKTKTVWEAYAKDIKHFILSKVKDVAVADDLLQETFIKVHTKLETLKDDDSLKPWLFSIARYTVMDYFRTLDKKTDIPESSIISEEPKSDHTKADCLRGIIKSLPKKYRDPLILADIQGLKTGRNLGAFTAAIAHGKISNSAWTKTHHTRFCGLLRF